MTGKVNDWSNAYESALVVGDTAADTNQINGMLTLINAVSGQVVSQTSAVAGDDLTLAKLDEAIDLVKGSDSRRDVAIIGSDLGVRKLNAALQSQRISFANYTYAGGSVVDAPRQSCWRPRTGLIPLIRIHGRRQQDH